VKLATGAILNGMWWTEVSQSLVDTENVTYSAVSLPVDANGSPASMGVACPGVWGVGNCPEILQEEDKSPTTGKMTCWRCGWTRLW
jgi:hypothetical protein